MANPIYRYRCPRCQKTQDIPGRYDADPPEVVSCPFCGCQEAKRTYTAPTPIFHGLGWTGARRPKG